MDFEFAPKEAGTLFVCLCLDHVMVKQKHWLEGAMKLMTGTEMLSCRLSGKPS